MAGDLAPVRQFDYPVGPFGSDANGLLRREYLHSKTLGLHHSAPGQIPTTESHRKSKIILDARAHACLTAGSFLLYHYRMQALRRPIDGCRQASRTSAHDRQVVE